MLLVERGGSGLGGRSSVRVGVLRNGRNTHETQSHIKGWLQGDILYPGVVASGRFSEHMVTPRNSTLLLGVLFIGSVPGWEW